MKRQAIAILMLSPFYFQIPLRDRLILVNEFIIEYLQEGKTMLTAKNVEEVFKFCLFNDGEDAIKAKIAEGVILTVGFHPDRLNDKKSEILEMLNELPDAFNADSGGGWSFLQACMTKDGSQWGEHSNIDQLLCLGIATEQAQILFPRSMWSVFPGGVPYFSVITKATGAN